MADDAQVRWDLFSLPSPPAQSEAHKMHLKSPVCADCLLSIAWAHLRECRCRRIDHIPYAVLCLEEERLRRDQKPSLQNRWNEYFQNWQARSRQGSSGRDWYLHREEVGRSLPIHTQHGCSQRCSPRIPTCKLNSYSRWHLQLLILYSLMCLKMASFLLWVRTATPRMMSRFPMERLVIKLRSFSALKKRIPVSWNLCTSGETLLTSEDVIVLTSMGEEVAIEAKEAPKSWTTHQILRHAFDLRAGVLGRRPMMMARNSECVLGLYALLVSQTTLLNILVDLSWGRLGFPPLSSGMSCGGPEHGSIRELNLTRGYWQSQRDQCRKEINYSITLQLRLANV